MNTETKTPKSVGSLAWGADSAPTYCEGIADLYSWSSNFDHLNPFRIFLDLVGYSLENLGEALVQDITKTPLGSLELSKLGEALVEWANRPQDCEAWVSELLSVESEFGL